MAKPKAKAKAKGKAAKEIGITEAIVLQCEQLPLTLAHKDTLMSVSLKRLDDLIFKAKGRTTPGLVQLYTEGFDSTCSTGSDVTSHGGMECLEKIKHAIRCLEAVRPLVQCLQNFEEGRAGGGAELLQWKRYAEETVTNLVAAASIMEVALKRELAAAFKVQSWDEYMNLLKDTEKWSGDESKPERDRIHLGALPEETRAPFQERMILKGLADLLRQEGQADSVKIYMSCFFQDAHPASVGQGVV